MIENYSRVQLLTDKYHVEGASRGDVGSVIEVYDNGDYEVEFADENGIDFAQIVAREGELEVLEAVSLVSATPRIIADVESITVPEAPQRKRQPSLK